MHMHENNINDNELEHSLVELKESHFPVNVTYICMHIAIIHGRAASLGQLVQLWNMPFAPSIDYIAFCPPQSFEASSPQTHTQNGAHRRSFEFLSHLLRTCGRGTFSSNDIFPIKALPQKHSNFSDCSAAVSTRTYIP